MTRDWGFSQVSVWRLDKCVSKKVEDNCEGDNVQHFNGGSYHLLQDIIASGASGYYSLYCLGLRT